MVVIFIEVTKFYVRVLIHPKVKLNPKYNFKPSVFYAPYLEIMTCRVDIETQNKNIWEARVCQSLAAILINSSIGEQTHIKIIEIEYRFILNLKHTNLSLIFSFFIQEYGHITKIYEILDHI